MVPKSKVFYTKAQANKFPALSCYALTLELLDGTITDGYYYHGQFYHQFEKITDQVKHWMIPQKGESVKAN